MADLSIRYQLCNKGLRMVKDTIRRCLAEEFGDDGRVAKRQDPAPRKVSREHIELAQPAFSCCLACKRPEGVSIQPMDCNDAGVVRSC